MGCGQSHFINPNLIAPTEDKNNLKPQEIRFRMSDFIHEINGNIKDQYRFIQPALGSGSYGKVNKAIHIKTNLKRAIKTIQKVKLKSSQLIFLQNQVENLKKLDHPNIIKIYQFYQDTDYFYIVTQLYQGGELHQKIVLNRKFNQHVAAEIMKQILSAIQYCHMNSIVHRDLKPQNILFETLETDSVLKIIDFGTSREYKIKQTLNQKIGTLYYIAPQVFSGSYNEKCDIWSCGVILYYLLTGTHPFTGANYQQIVKKAYKLQIFNTPYLRQISDQLKDLLRHMFNRDKDKRFSATECINHEWFKKYTEQKKVAKATISKIMTNMLSFKIQSKIHYATWMYLVNILSTKQEKRQLLKVFKKINKKNNGLIGKIQLQEVLREISVDEKMIAQCEKFFEFINKQEISFTQFVIYSINRKSILMDSNLEKVFKMIDKDENKSISVLELMQTLGASKTFSIKIWQQLIKQGNSNHQEYITFNEFKRMMKSILN